MAEGDLDLALEDMAAIGFVFEDLDEDGSVLE